ncbi:MAG: tRNA-intron lyase [Sulfolobus sp.]|jgi:tRNA-intron endonuclease|nr:tRNA-intron lyase [Sulfolobaceae archaeon]
MINGELIGDKVIVKDINEAREVYKLGFYGKPLNISKPKSAEDINSPVLLSLIEATYLVKRGLIKVVTKDKEEKEIELGFDELYKIGVESIPRFSLLYLVYEDLRNKNYVVRSGIKYGADFAVYTIAPGIEHAPYLVLVLKEDEIIYPNEILGFGRVSHSTRKELVLAIVNANSKKIRYIIFKWLKM